MRKTPALVIALGCVGTLLFGCANSGGDRAAVQEDDAIEQAMQVAESQEPMASNATQDNELPFDFLSEEATLNDAFCKALRDLDYSRLQYTYWEDSIDNPEPGYNACSFRTRTEMDGQPEGRMMVFLGPGLVEELPEDVIQLSHDEATGSTTLFVTYGFQIFCYVNKELPNGALLVGVTNLDLQFEEMCVDATEMTQFIHQKLFEGEEYNGFGI